MSVAIRHGQITLASLRSLATSSSTSATLPPPLRFGGSTTLSVVEPRRDVDAERGGLGRLQRLLLRLHDVGQRRVARLVQAQVGGDHQRQRRSRWSRARRRPRA